MISLKEPSNRDVLYDEFLEEAINLSPADREERQVEIEINLCPESMTRREKQYRK